MSENLNINLEKHIKYLNMMFDVSTIANQTDDVYSLINELAKYCEKVTKTNHVTFYLLENQFYKCIYTNEKTRDNEFFESEEGKSGFWDAANSSRIVKMKDDKGIHLYKSFLEYNNIAFLDPTYVRVFFSKEIPICYCFIKENPDNPIDEATIENLNSAFSYIEPIIGKYHRQIKKNEEIAQLQKSLHNISILYNISQAVNFIDDLKRLISVILDKAIETVNAEKGSLMLYDPADNTLQVKVVYGLKDKKHENDINNGIIECQKMKPESGIAGKVFTEKKSIITNLGGQDPRFNQLSGGDSNVSSLICVPLIAKGECIGIINITNKKNGKLFNKKDLEFVEALANQAAIAVDNAQLYELATKDGLTKLYIHRHFYFLLESEIKRVQRYHHVLSLLMLDIDNFKHVNDTYGHLVGDMVLKEIAATIQKTIRHVDIPARYGGEEFTIILPETAALNAVTIAERLRKKISEIEVKVDDNTIIRPTVSIGIAEYPNAADDIKDLIDWADKALYVSKENGKNCIHLYFDGKFTRYNPS